MAPSFVRDARGTRYRLGELAGKGGQALVYRLPGRSDWLAKIYHHADGQTENKLAWMIANPPEDPSQKINHASIAWPTRLVYAERRFAGYLMPYIHGAVPLLRVFNPRLRRRTFPNFNERYQVNTAHNLAAALGALHERGYVVGDLNESNILVTPATLVTMIDTDSFQVVARTRLGLAKLYPCPVGKVEYLPPELQGKKLAGIERRPEHDRFALGVLIFQLLMEGSHPFRAKWTGPGEKPGMQERIARGWFPYQDRPPRHIEPALRLEDLHPELVGLFKRCFILGHRNAEARPAPAEWERGLENADRALQPCGKGHYFGRHLSECPACLRLSPTSRPVRVAPGPPGSRPRPSPSFPSAPPQAPARSLFPPVRLPVGLRGRAAWVRQNIIARPAGRILAAGGLGLLIGAILGNSFPAEILGGTFGLAAGLVSGTLVGETIRKTFGWPTFWSAVGALLCIFLAGGLSAPFWSWGISALALGLMGWTIGRYGNQPGWTLLWTLGGAIGGWLAGRAVAGLPASSWAGGSLSGGSLAVLTASIYTLWRKYV